MNRKARRFLWIVVCLLLLTLPAVLLVITQSSIPAVDGLLLGGWLIVFGVGAFELFASRTVATQQFICADLHWRRLWLQSARP